jgi:4-hydroxybenzoate polyprenyltransferase
MKSPVSLAQPPASLASRWTTYVLERSPPAALLFICLGIALSPMALLQDLHAGILILGVAGSFGLLAQMRLGDEIKDFEKDRIVHPERPLPRGLLSIAEVQLGMKILMGSLLALAAIGGYLYSALGGLLLALCVIYIWLMYREFFIGERLQKSPMLYAVSHQVIVYPLYGWVGALYGLTVFANPEFIAWMTHNFGASVTFEICRKLDPKSHALQGTYLHHYGPKITAGIISIFVLISIAAGFYAEHHMYLLWVQIPLLFSLLLIPFKPDKYRLIEGLSILAATVHLWVPVIRWMHFKWMGLGP